MTVETVSPLPPLYAKWFDDLLGGSIPSETRATCQDCAMCDGEAEQKQADIKLFNPQSKCCTYLPRLQNFLVGMILEDEDPAMAKGRATVEKRLQAGLAVTPLGLEQPMKARLLYTQMEPLAFGRAQSQRCPHYISEQGGLCGIWKYRNSICSTWFCRYVRGAVGREFWETAKRLLLAVEDDLSRWCAVKLDLDDTALALLLPPRIGAGQQIGLMPPTLTLEDMDDLVDPDRQRRIWGNWHGREHEFYRACAELVAPLSWSDVLSICGPEVQARVRLTQKAHNKLVAADIPERLRMGSFAIAEAKSGFYSLYHRENGIDTFRLSARVMRFKLRWPADDRNRRSDC